jgi:trans-2-enoyl-CoA reductase
MLTLKKMAKSKEPVFSFLYKTMGFLIMYKGSIGTAKKILSRIIKSL